VQEHWLESGFVVGEKFVELWRENIRVACALAKIVQLPVMRAISQSIDWKPNVAQIFNSASSNHSRVAK
jgi:hypothetical protein